MNEDILRAMEEELMVYAEEIAAETDRAEREKLSRERNALLQQYLDYYHYALEYSDKEERRKLDKEKNDAQTEVEKMKASIDWKRVGFDMAKLLVPLIINWKLQFKSQDRCFGFEQNGYAASSTSRKHIWDMPRFVLWK